MKKKMRMLCIGGCGREVVKKLSAECRKCRRARIHAGLKRKLRLARGTAPLPGVARMRHGSRGIVLD